MLNLKTEQWTQGPNMKQYKRQHSCFYDEKTNSIFTIGGLSGSDKSATTEQWKLDTNHWEPTPSLPEPLWSAAGVASNSMDYIGFVAGGSTNSGGSDKVLGLRRMDLGWQVIPQKLKTARSGHSIVNLPLDQIPGC